MRVATSTGLGAFLLTASSIVNAIELDINSTDSILRASSTIVQNILQIYNNGSDTGPPIPGLLPDPYYWWEAGYMFDSLINYWSLSGNDSIVQTIQEGMLFQTGPDNDYLPPNQTRNLGNDDQALWALASMTAAEKGFPLPSGSNVTWIQLAENVFNEHVARWDDDTCNGGLRWQLFTFNNGYNYKNSISQGTFAYLGARLARYTGNSTYSDWAQKAVDWTRNVKLLTSDGAIYDGTDATLNCSELNHIQWTINAGLFMNTASYLVNISQSSAWNDLLWPVFLESTKIFTDAGASANSQGRSIITEVACTMEDNCNVDQKAYKATLARALNIFQSQTASSPSTFNGTSSSDAYSRAAAILRASAEGAAAQCSGGDDGTTCGFDWSSSTWDGTSGMGQELNALEVLLANLPAKALNTANDTSIAGSGGSGSNSTSTEESGGSNSTGTSTGSAESASSSTSGAAGLWSSSAFVALFSAIAISVLRLSL
ncbi:glycoside hydrolase family 76 protein [Zasmidium cellare ATCC 36951]|uniref:Mannan endo-1,6-alpha-mannosidase n=1 Tax=Zasmidium cellare ATCC 36951 TaxID=1080233 RepID=A0A6A6CT09_ZASCE|nr:glycoside hydrolase family 76 protein [Zasmidium cellare ATCC 36951]KAF2170284.1 glycoside hydrolase family 76 protein [Zasmidium cellare ATCC 36951]